MSLSLWELAATPLSEGQKMGAINWTSRSRGIPAFDLEFQSWLTAQLEQRKLAQPQFLRDAGNGEYLNAAVQTLYQTWRSEHASG
ncbi:MULTISPECIES: hypothetical protein [Pseudomonas]|uniref:Uncharacterized protein n=1 Tax=Pseudomonas juntendi TaxID=2666183 RepID=A0A7W2LYZ9_9PSED|nr:MULTISPECIES: hypothetical protein [Pseudomonas]MBA6134674.1 hypothetical protein [Pseudomonas juntendi]MBA6149685.1 hypothetical protein [Pseudomonas juntendi]MBH3383212.1 hypothetical protein [Pseudomonas juntendi]MBR7523150.1 hypothetical protein [Pseudomonas juntendi]WEA18599.1 hypothetical protein PWA60_14900 [Pseudomonas juntendi]